MHRHNTMSYASDPAHLSLVAPSVSAALPQIAFAAAPPSLSGMHFAPVSSSSRQGTFAPTRPECLQAGVLRFNISVDDDQYCEARANISVDDDQLASLIRQVYMESTGRSPMPADITLDVLYAAKHRAVELQNTNLVALAGMAYGRALASQAPRSMAYYSNSCSFQSGVPVPAVMASNALITQQVSNTLQAASAAAHAQSLSMNAVPKTLLAAAQRCV